MSDKKSMPSSVLGEIAHANPASLKHVVPDEKNPLPTTEDLQTEKSHQNIFEDVTSFKRNSLKRANTIEKSVLPDSPTISKEKEEVNLRQGIESFSRDNLKHQEPLEKQALPAEPVDLFKQKKVVDGVGQFDKVALKHVQTDVKNPLPDQENVNAEKEHQGFVQSIEGFNKSELQHTATSGTDPRVIYTQEKVVEGLGQFDKGVLKHVEPTEKNPLPTKEVIEQERKSVSS